MDLRRRANWLTALLEQSNVCRWPRGVWMFTRACAIAEQDSEFGCGRVRCGIATGADAAFGRNHDLPIVQSGLHARARFVVVDCEVSRLDFRREMDPALGGPRFREWFP